MRAMKPRAPPARACPSPSSSGSFKPTTEPPRTGRFPRKLRLGERVTVFQTGLRIGVRLSCMQSSVARLCTWRRRRSGPARAGRSRPPYSPSRGVPLRAGRCRCYCTLTRGAPREQGYRRTTNYLVDERMGRVGRDRDDDVREGPLQPHDADE